jgi:hypothetical protein
VQTVEFLHRFLRGKVKGGSDSAGSQFSVRTNCHKRVSFRVSFTLSLASRFRAGRGKRYPLMKVSDLVKSHITFSTYTAGDGSLSKLDLNPTTQSKVIAFWVLARNLTLSLASRF